MKLCSECGNILKSQRKFCCVGCAHRWRVKNIQPAVDKKTLFREFCTEKITVVDLSLKYNVSVVTIYNYLKKYGIETPKENHFLDFTGKIIGTTAVLYRATEPQKGGGKHVKWLCRCACGKEFLTFSHHLSRSISVRCRECSGKSRRSNLELKRYIWNAMRYSARKMGRVFDIEREWAYDLFLKQDRKCALSGVDIQFAICAAEHSKGCTTASLDRVDSLRGYTADNVRWVHKEVNFMRGNRTDESYIGWCKKIAAYN